jgi:hypothetical protein
MIDVQPPSNTTQDATRGMLPWLITLMLGVVGALWAAFKGKDAKLVGSLEAQLTAKDDIIKERDATIRGLGEKLDKQRGDAEAKLEETRTSHKRDMDRALSAILNNDWHEAPTGMRAICEMVEKSSTRPGPPELPPPRLPPVRIPR